MQNRFATARGRATQTLHITTQANFPDQYTGCFLCCPITHLSTISRARSLERGSSAYEASNEKEPQDNKKGRRTGKVHISSWHDRIHTARGGLILFLWLSSDSLRPAVPDKFLCVTTRGLLVGWLASFPPKIVFGGPGRCYSLISIKPCGVGPKTRRGKINSGMTLASQGFPSSGRSVVSGGLM